MPRTWLETFDAHLTLQAEMSFEAELGFFDCPAWQAATTVLDLGTGNGAYLERLASVFPDKEFVGLDHEPWLVERARERSTASNVEYRCGEVGDLEPELTVDVLMARFCLMYTKGMDRIAAWAGRSVASAILEVDNADEFLSFPPELHDFASQLTISRRIAADGGSRSAASTTEPHWVANGFARASEHPLVVSSEPPYSRSLLHRWLALMGELELGSPLSAETADELLSWSLGTGSVRYGMRATWFERATAG